MAAARKTVPVWKAADLGVDPARVGSGGRRLEVRDVALVQRDSRCEMVGGESPAEQAEGLVQRLRELKVI
jgi:electron transfer flavoprotein alpha/beta subunit